jgi:hypothetical protein
MGYVNDKAFAQWIAPGVIARTAGAWTPTLASHTVGEVRTAEAGTFNLLAPVLVPSNAEGLKGARLLSVELVYKIGTAAMTSVTTVELEKGLIAADGALSGAAAALTLDGNHNTSAKRAGVGDHRLLASLDAPAFVDNDEVYWLYVTFNAPATTIFTLWGAIANYELRA